MTTTGGEFLQQPTHAELITPALPSITSHVTTRLDAIIVPASRPAGNLATAISLAQATGCHLVVLCSMQTQPNDVHALFDEKNFSEGTVVKLPSAYDHWRFRFKTTDWTQHGPGQRVCGARHSDLSAKRNIGLLLARILGWRRIFFLDDDIRNVSATMLLTTVSLLGANGKGHRTAGMTVREFPDNSVVCHARRVVGEVQDVFVSGSVLAVDCTAPFAFFPDIYNEDWLFFYRDVAAKRLANSGLSAEQLPYDPFAEPQRAEGQEFGDVIAEGLYALFHGKNIRRVTTSGYWSQFLDDRKRVLKEVGNRLEAAPRELQGELDKVLLAVEDTLSAITPRMCVRYLETWQKDLLSWKGIREGLPQHGSVTDALRELGLSPADPAL
jgi:hypothetical protein